MPQRRQAGGAMKKIGPLTPTITSPETMAEQCQFELLFAHGSTMMNQLMIVPKDTFLLFLGPSGYYNYPSKLNRALVLTNTFQTIDGYYKNMYDNFFSKEDVRAERPAYPYPSSQIYTPGDIIHDIGLSFYSDHTKHVVFFYGVHTLPITETPLEANGSMADPLTDHTIFLKSTHYVSYVLYLVAKGNIDETLLNTFQVKPEVKDEFDRLVALSTYNAIDNGLAILNPTKEEDIYALDYWFNNPVNVMNTVIHPYEKSHPNNQYKFTGKYRNTLSTVLKDYPNTVIGSPKQYRFIMIQACRGPDVELGTFHIPKFSNWNRYRNLPPSQLTLASAPQKLARRMSFASKQPAEVCPVGIGATPMNLASVKKAMEELAPHIKDYTDVIGGKHEHEFLRLIYESFFKIKPTVKVRILKKGELLSYDTTVNTRTFLRAIDMAFQPFPLLESEDPSKAATKSRFQIVLQTFQNMVRAYATSAVLNDPMGPRRTVGEHIFNQISNVKTVLHSDYDREKMQQGIQTKLLRTNEGRDAIRPITNEMSELYSELLTIYPINNTIFGDYDKKIPPLMKNVSEEGYQEINKVFDTYIATSKTILTQIGEIRKKLNKNMNEIDSLIKRYPVVSTLFFSEFDQRFKEKPNLATFSIRKACESLLGDCIIIQNTMDNLQTKIDRDTRIYTRELNIVREKTKTVIQALVDDTNAIQNYDTSVKTFIQRKQAFEATISQKNRTQSIPEQTYQSNMEGLTTLLKEMNDFERENDMFNVTKSLQKFMNNKDYETIFKNQPIESYAPDFRTPYTKNMKQTADSYRGNLWSLLITIHDKLSINIRVVERMIETYTNQYTAQQRAPAKANSTQTRKNRPRNASMVSGSTSKPKNTQRNRPRNASIVSGAAGSTRPNQTNQTRKKPWWEKRREKQAAKRNQTRRNGPNGLPVIPGL